MGEKLIKRVTTVEEFVADDAGAKDCADDTEADDGDEDEDEEDETD